MSLANSALEKTARSVGTWGLSVNGAQSDLQEKQFRLVSKTDVAVAQGGQQGSGLHPQAHRERPRV